MKTQYLHLFAILLGLAIGTSCSSVKQNASDAGAPPKEMKDHDVIEAPNSAIDLSDHLRTVPGVLVIGHGANARIRIRGATNSINSSSDPLFVVNGSEFNGGFEQVYTFVNVNDIKRIKVLKDATELALYGVRGANGVIEITLK